MRINLTTPFAEKDQVKALGARWDSQRKLWYITDVEDLTPFARWIPDLAAPQKPGAPTGQPRSQPSSQPPRQPSSASTHFIDHTPPPPHCGCDALPWEPCIHTPPSVGAGAELS